MSCPSQQSVSIRGEANISRYLSRLFPLQLAYENSAGVDSAAEIDRLLDMTEAGAVFGVGGAASAAGPGHNKDRGQALNILEQALLQRPAAGVTALPDAVVYSALLNSKVTPASVGAAPGWSSAIGWRRSDSFRRRRREFEIWREFKN